MGKQTWKWSAHFLWESIPSSLQDRIRSYLWDAVLGTIVMVGYFIWKATMSFGGQPWDVIILLGIGFFTVTLYLAHFIRPRLHDWRKRIWFSGESPINKVEDKKAKRMKLLQLRQEGVLLHNEIITPDQFNPLPPHRSWHSDFNDWHTKVVYAAGNVDHELKAMLMPIRNLPSWDKGKWISSQHQMEQNMIWEICERVEKYLENTRSFDTE